MLEVQEGSGRFSAGIRLSRAQASFADGLLVHSLVTSLKVL